MIIRTLKKLIPFSLVLAGSLIDYFFPDYFGSRSPQLAFLANMPPVEETS